jgi:hypothetical protein
MRCCHFRAWVKDQYTRTSLPVLVVGILTLTVAVANYCLQKNAYNRPELAASGGTIYLERDPITAELNWTNVGKKPARDGKVTLFQMSENGVRNQIGEGEVLIAGVGSVIAVDRAGGAKIRLHNTEETHGAAFLSCIIYYDENGEKYRQGFRYRRGDVEPKYIKLEVLTTLKYVDVCL